MMGDSIAELNKGIQLFAQDVKEDRLARKRSELLVVTFGGSANIAIPFTEAQNFVPPILAAGGQTPLAEALLIALRELEEQKAAYKRSGLEYFRPWLIVMTDGAPTDDAGRIEEAIRQLTAAQTRKAITVFAIGVGAYADMTFLNRLSLDRQAVELKSIQSFSAFFLWLSASLSQVSASNTQVSGDSGLAQTSQVALPSPSGWTSA
jgi:uncharacterized protein YegL